MNPNQNDYLEHFGVKGMHWGIRKKRETSGRIPSTSKNTKSSSVRGKATLKMRGKPKKGMMDFDIFDSNGKKVGDLSMDHVSDSEVYFNWFSIRGKKNQGQGYAQAAMKQAIAEAKKMGYKKMTAECVGSNGGRALHIAEKYGAKVVGPTTKNSVWGSMTPVEWDLTRELKHSDDYLEHYGVKGMKWGVRKAKDTVSRLRAKRESKYSDDYRRYKSAKRRKTSELSNAELKDLINRGNLEQQYRNLKKQDISAGRKFVQDVLYKSATSTASGIVTKKMREGVEYAGSKVTSYRYLKSKGMV